MVLPTCYGPSWVSTQGKSVTLQCMTRTLISKEIYMKRLQRRTVNREQMLNLREELLAVEENRMKGNTGCTLEELDDYLNGVIEEVYE